ncbi:hypothetical protein AMEX_G23174 [Astyanax mexicanus]|uniref:Integrase core domain-containing protein n=1 Tax=Astyanax mexicanus TaxID=7994 RepID=A0A8T2KUC1_ASTMX|nr:hypothetical protein AMEX_G23174 [Astyanax mexicanus]
MTVKRDDVMHMMAELDPAGIQQHSTHRFVRRERLRTDCGTDNGVMAATHCALRSDHMDEFAGARSHMYGSSTSNQRIESWWSCFRKQKTQFWMDLFSDLRERHLFNGSYEDTCLLRYSFLEVLQKELDDYKQLWNTHTIRPVRQSYCPSGKPDAMYYLSERFSGRNCGFAVSQLTLNQFDTMVPDHFSLCGDDNHQNHFEELQRQSGLTAPTDWTEAVEHYITLKSLTGV